MDISLFYQESIMTKSAATSRDTASSTATESSSADFDFDLERDIPTTEEDVRVQRELHSQPGVNLLPRIDELLNPRDLENIPPRRTTSEGWPPFELE